MQFFGDTTITNLTVRGDLLLPFANTNPKEGLLAYDPESKKVTYGNGTEVVEIDGAHDYISGTDHYTGFPNRTDTSLSFADGTLFSEPVDINISR